MKNTPNAIPDLPLPDWDALQQIEIQECDEALQPASLCREWLTWPAYYHQQVTGALPECYLRSELFRRLLLAARALPDGKQLVILDGWRPFAVQQYLYETLINLMRHADPSQSENARQQEARRLVSPPSTEANAPSPHLTGGAVDVTLANADGLLMDMGSLFDEPGPRSATAALENSTRSSDREARDNRRVLYHAMIGAGFTNLPSEWWHYDFGDQLWAWYSGADSARYSATRPYSLERLWQQRFGTPATAATEIKR